MIDNTYERLMVALQRGIPLTREPFVTLAEQLGLSESDVLAGLDRLFDGGLARRFGAVFDVRRLGYRSSLCAARLSESQLDDTVPHVTRMQGVTHCYLRGWPDELDPLWPGGPGRDDATPNLWFTLAASAETFDTDMAEMASRFPEGALQVLPALRRFKIDVVLDPNARKRMETFPGSLPDDDDDVPILSDDDKRVIRALQGNLARTAHPFDTAAEYLGCTPEALLKRLTTWKACGVLRRVGVILHHRKAGFKANGMCVWPCHTGEIHGAGRRLSAMPEVTHCYQRPSLPVFPYDLYAMIHAAEWADTLDLFERISKDANLTNGRILFSLREYKKISPIYFPEVA